MSLKSAHLTSSAAACEEGRGLVTAAPQPADCRPCRSRLCVCLRRTDEDRRSRSGSGGLLECAQQEETQQVQQQEDQHQADKNLLHPQTHIELLLQPGVAGHHLHELVRFTKENTTKVHDPAFDIWNTL